MSDPAIPPTPPGEPEDSVAPSTLEAPAALPEPAVRDDLRTTWEVTDLVVFAVYSLGVLWLLTNVVATIAISQFGVPLDRIAEVSTTDARFIVCRQVLWFLCLLLYMYAVVRRRSAVPFWHALGWRGLRSGTLTAPFLALILLLVGCAMAIAADVASEFYSTQKHLPIEALFASRRSVLYLMAYGLLVAPLAEETVFRGFIYPVLARKFGIFAGVTLTGILFGLVHVPQLLGGWGQIATLVAVGMALTAVRAALGSVAASYMLHLGYNGFLFGGYWVATGALRHLPN
jgi:CAAX protease family protein